MDGKHFHLRGLKTFFQQAVFLFPSSGWGIGRILIESDPSYYSLSLKALILRQSHLYERLRRCWRNEAQWYFTAAQRKNTSVLVGRKQLGSDSLTRPPPGPRSPPAHVACVKMTHLISVENNTGLSLWHRMLYWRSAIDGPMKRAGHSAKSARWFDWLELCSNSRALQPMERFK